VPEPGSLLVTRENIVVFICVENAARSLMAEAMFNAQAPDGWRAVSAGTQPARAPNPRTGSMLAEIGLALPAHPPQLLTPEIMDAASLRVTMGCLDDASCPARLKALPLRDWGLADPAKLDDAGFRQVRDDIRDRVERLRREILLIDRRRAARPPPTAP
jgi:arsenate reductase